MRCPIFWTLTTYQPIFKLTPYGKINIAFTSNLSTNGAVMVGAGLAYSLAIEGAALWDPSKITYRPLFPALTTTSVLAWKRGQPFSLAATKFIDQIRCFFRHGYA